MLCPRSTQTRFNSFSWTLLCFVLGIEAVTNSTVASPAAPKLFRRGEAALTSPASPLFQTDSVNEGVATVADVQHYVPGRHFEVASAQELAAEIKAFGAEATEASAVAQRKGKARTADMLQRAAQAAALDSENILLGRFQMYNPGGLVELPSSWRRPGERWLAVFRNVTVSPEWHSDPELGSWPTWMSNQAVLAILSEDMLPVRPLHILRLSHIFGKQFICQRSDKRLGEETTIFGLEDVRLFARPDGSNESELLLFFNSHAYFTQPNVQCPKSGRVRMYMARLGQDLRPDAGGVIEVPKNIPTFSGEVASLLQKIPLPRQGKMAAVEKNWSPFLYQSPPSAAPRVLLEYSVFPHIVLDLNTTNRKAGNSNFWATSSQQFHAWRRHQWSLGRRFINLHGGVSPILLEIWPGRPEAFLSVLHTQERQEGSDGVLYRSYLYVFEPSPPFAILGVAERDLPMIRKQHCFKEGFCDDSRIAFPLSLFSHTDSRGIKELWLLYGSGDSESRRLVISQNELQALLPLPVELPVLV